MIRAILLDIDGTLTNDKKEITPRTREALLKIQDHSPQIFRVLSGASQETLIAVVGMIISLNEIADIVFSVPLTCYEILPFRSH